MRSPLVTPLPFATPSVPLLDASFLPAEEEWEVLEALHAQRDFDDDDRYSDVGFSTGDFD